MHLFYLLNGWAGQTAWLDTALRFYYVGAVPLLATVLAALLILAPRPKGVPSRWNVALAAGLSTGLCTLTMWAVSAAAWRYLHTDTLSPRPFVTHYVNALVVEPNDNSFPCPEVMLAAMLATMLWAAAPWAGVAGWLGVLALTFARLYCGSNYPADVAAGAALGGAWGTLALAACRVGLALPSISWLARGRSERRAPGRFGLQAACSGLTVVATLVATVAGLEQTPRYGAAIRQLLHEPSTALAEPVASLPAPPDTPQRPAGVGETVPREGEGVVAPGAGESGAASDAPADSPSLEARDSHRAGYLPQAEAMLRATLAARGLPHHILSIDVAQIKAGTSAYRCAAIRFEVKNEGTAERRRVTQTAAAIVRLAFAVDPQLQNVDVIGLILNESGRSGSGHVFQSGNVPVFTASVTRNSLVLSNRPAWVNLPGLEGGLWLRARSLLYINSRVLPPAPTKPAPPAPVPIAAPAATPRVVPSATPQATPQVTPHATPQVTPTAAPARTATPPPPAPTAPPAAPVATAPPQAPAPATIKRAPQRPRRSYRRYRRYRRHRWRG